MKHNHSAQETIKLLLCRALRVAFSTSFQAALLIGSWASEPIVMSWGSSSILLPNTHVVWPSWGHQASPFSLYKAEQKPSYIFMQPLHDIKILNAGNKKADPITFGVQGLTFCLAFMQDLQGGENCKYSHTSPVPTQKLEIIKSFKNSYSYICI